MARFVLSAILLCLAIGQAGANDSVAEIKTGGLVLGRTDAIEMAREDLFVSLDEIAVSYTFRNQSDTEIETVVAFPMPDIQVNPWGDTALPDLAGDNFLDFSVTVDGQPVKVNLQQRAFAAELDITDDLQRHAIALFPFADGIEAQLDALPADLIDEWQSRGIVRLDRYDIGTGMKVHRTPYWVLKSTYWWTMKFPAGMPVRVEHRYKPSVGGTAGVNFFQDGKFAGPAFAEYKARYCMDDGFTNAIVKRMRERKAEYPPFTEARIAYVLRTAANWAGTVGTFTLTVDKGAPQNLVSFCGKNVRKLDATTFEMRIDDFLPERDLDLLFLKPAGW